jgi:hypothetical protein
VKFCQFLLTACLGASMFCVPLSAQTPASRGASAAVPRLVNLSGKAVDGEGKIITGVVAVTLALYEEQSGGSPLWVEDQNMIADSRGNYTVQLGANTREGLPLELFATGAARWLGIRMNGGEEQPRVLLLSVPYALKAADAETVGGLPASAFVLAGSSSNGWQAQPESQSSAGTVEPQVAGTGTAGVIPKWTDNNGGLGNSAITQSGTGSAAKIGINTATPAATLDVTGSAIVRGNLNLPPLGTATATAGEGSRTVSFTASAFNSGTNAAVTQTFGWLASPMGNNTANPSGTMNLIYRAGTGPTKNTGLRIGSNGHITFAAGQTFPAGTVTGSETVQGNVSAAQLISTAPQGTPPLEVSSSTQVPNLNASLLGGQPASAFATVGPNAFFGNQIITGNVGIGTSSPVEALDLGSNNNMIIRVDPGSDTTQALGGYALLGRAAGGAFNSWWTLTSPVGGGFGVPANSYSIWQYPAKPTPGCCLPRFTILPAEASSDTGGTVTIDQNGSIDQPRGAGGAVKAMLHFSPFNNGRIISCFNSALSGAAATTPPCGLSFHIAGTGDYIFDFGFKVDDRIYSTTPSACIDCIVSVCGNADGQCEHTGTLTNNQVEVVGWDPLISDMSDTKFHLIIY